MLDPQKKRARRLTPKQRKVVQFVAENPDATQNEIAAAVGRGDRSAVSKIVNNPNVQQRMAEAMARCPALQDEAIVLKIKEGLDAYQVQRLYDRKGKLNEYKDADFHARKSYLSLFGKWSGIEVNRTELSGPGGGPIELATVEALKQLTKEDLLALVRSTEAPK